MARAIASQVVDEQHRDSMVGCKPAKPTEPDDACARQFLTKAGRLLYRRPLTEHELQAEVAGAAEATRKVHDF